MMNILFNKVYFKIMFIFSAFFSTFSFNALNLNTNILLYICALWSIPLIIYNIIKRRHEYDIKHNILIILFFIILCMSSFFHNFNFDTIIILWIDFIMIFVFFMNSKDIKEIDIVKELKFICKCISFVFFVGTFISLLFLFTQDYIRVGSSYIGFYGKGLIGIYGNSNLGGICALISIICSIYLLKVECNRKTNIIFHMLNIASQITFLIFSKCRSAQLGLIVIIALFLILNYKVLMKNKKIALIFMLYILMFNSGMIFSNQILSVLVPTQNEIIDINKNEIESNEKFEDEVLESEVELTEVEKLHKLNKFEKVINELSTSRYLIWKEEFYLIKFSPLYGYGVNNQINVAKKRLGDGSIIVQRGFRGSHNLFAEVLFTSGFIGLIIFIIFVIKHICYIFKLLCRTNDDYRTEIHIIVYFIVGIGFFAMLDQSVFNIHSINSIMFWTCIGYLDVIYKNRGIANEAEIDIC